MTSTPDAYTVEQIDSLGVTASLHLSESTRALRNMAANMQSTIDRLLSLADAVDARRDSLDEAASSESPGLDFRLGSTVTSITEATFGALRNDNLLVRAEQAVTSANRAVEAVNTARALSERL